MGRLWILFRSQKVHALLNVSTYICWKEIMNVYGAVAVEIIKARVPGTRGGCVCFGEGASSLNFNGNLGYGHMLAKSR